MIGLMVPNAFAEISITDNATGGDCITIGIWDSSTKTCTLTSNITDNIIINSDGITLDGNNHTLRMDQSLHQNMIYSYIQNDITVKNLNITGCGNNPITVEYGSNIVIKNNKIHTDQNQTFEGNQCIFSIAINLPNVSSFIVSNNEIIDVLDSGFWATGGIDSKSEFSGNSISRSAMKYDERFMKMMEDRQNAAITVTNGNGFVEIFGNIVEGYDEAISANGSLVFENTLKNNQISVMKSGSGTIFYHNNFIGNDLLHPDPYYSLNDPNLNGNYFDVPCADSNYDNICDDAIFYGHTEITHSWNIPDGWLTNINLESDVDTHEAESSSGSLIEFFISAERNEKTLNVSCNLSSGSIFPIGETQVVCSTINGRTHAFFINILDTIPPQITVPSNIILDAIDAHGASTEYDDVLVSDVVGIKKSSCNMDSGMLFPIGQNVVKCTAEDTSGNISSETFTVTVVSDVPPPVIFVPETIVIQADSQKETSVNFPSITATDELGILEEPTCNPMSGSFFPVGTTIVECKAKNMQQYVGTATFSVIVNPPPNITRELIPLRDDIGTEWKFPTNKSVYDELRDSRSLHPDDFNGFTEFTWIGYMKGTGYDANFLDLYIYRFNEPSNAYVFYSEHVNYWYERGGYSEWNPSWGAVDSDECYGRITPGMYTDKLSLYCILDNIVTFSTTTGYEFEMKDELSNFADAVFSKASEISTMERVTEVNQKEVFEMLGLDEPESNPMCGEGTVSKNGQCVVEEEEGGGCLIATAAFGSEMAPQVQFLREIRDNTVMSTQSGTAFMTGFNQFYYSFSPAVADLERQNPIFKEAVKVSLTPLLTSLTLLNYVDVDTEEEMLGYGISIILLNIGMYFVAPAALIIALKK